MNITIAKYKTNGKIRYAADITTASAKLLHFTGSRVNNSKWHDYKQPYTHQNQQTAIAFKEILNIAFGISIHNPHHTPSSSFHIGTIPLN